MKKKCEQCGREFDRYYKNSRFCSKNCWYEFSRGSKIGEYPEERVLSMVEGKRKAFFKKYEKEVDMLKKMIDSGFCLSVLNYSKQLNISPSTIKKLMPDISLNEKIPQVYQEYNFQDFLKIKKDILNMVTTKDVKRITSKYRGANNFNERKLYFILTGTRFRVANPLLQTVPEAKVEAFLREQGLSYKKEVSIPNPVGGSFRVDFVVDEKMAIEVHGDYWHGNPLVYREENLNETQLNNKMRDVEKLKAMKKMFEKCLIIWEKEIKNSPEKVKRRINESYHNV